MKTIESFEIENEVFEIKKSVYENERKFRTEIKFFIFKNGNDVTYELVPPFTFFEDVEGARQGIILQFKRRGKK